VEKSFSVSFLIITAAHFGAPWSLLPGAAAPKHPAGYAVLAGVQF